MSILRPQNSGALFYYKILFASAAARAIFHCMEPVVDAHCHYEPNAFREYIGGGLFVCNAVRESDWAPMLTAAQTDTRIRVALGLHPWAAASAAVGWDTRLFDILAANPDVMVGEIGMDRSRGDFSAQYDAFCRQYGLAARLHRTAHIHCVRTWDVMLRVLKTMPRPPAIVLHRFGASPQILQTLIKSDANIYFSYQTATGLHAVRLIAATPADRILIETDGNAPDVTRLESLTRDIAAIRGGSPAAMSATIFENTIRMIKHGQTA